MRLLNFDLFCNRESAGSFRSLHSCFGPAEQPCPVSLDFLRNITLFIIIDGITSREITLGDLEAIAVTQCHQIMDQSSGKFNYTILYYTILYYTILYYTILYYTILYYTILYYTILYYTILYYTILYYTILYYTILYYTILYYTILYYTILYYTILYYTILYYTFISALSKHINAYSLQYHI